LYRAAIISILMICSCVISFGQSEPKKNIEIFEETISAALEKYYYYPGVNRDNVFIFVVNPMEQGGNNESADEASRFLKGIIKKTASKDNLKFSFAEDPSIINDSAYNLLIMQIVNLETKYTGFKKNRFLGDKTLIRNIITNITVELKTGDGIVNIKDIIKNTSQDEVDYDNYQQLESAGYDFTRGTPPNISAFERIIFPVLLICVTAAATVIFFTIRSK
jgi:hypothetical protein